MNWMIFAFFWYALGSVSLLLFTRDWSINIPVTPISRESNRILAYKGFKNKSPRNTNTPKHPPLNPPFF